MQITNINPATLDQLQFIPRISVIPVYFFCLCWCWKVLAVYINQYCTVAEKYFEYFTALHTASDLLNVKLVSKSVFQTIPSSLTTHIVCNSYGVAFYKQLFVLSFNGAKMIGVTSLIIIYLDSSILFFSLSTELEVKYINFLII